MDDETAQLKKTMVALLKQTIALLTLEKTNTAASYFIGLAPDVDTIVTDVSPDDEKLQVYKEAGVTIIYLLYI